MDNVRLLHRSSLPVFDNVAAMSAELGYLIYMLRSTAVSARVAGAADERPSARVGRGVRAWCTRVLGRCWAGADERLACSGGFGLGVRVLWHSRARALHAHTYSFGPALVRSRTSLSYADSFQVWAVSSVVSGPFEKDKYQSCVATCDRILDFLYAPSPTVTDAAGGAYVNVDAALSEPPMPKVKGLRRSARDRARGSPRGSPRAVGGGGGVGVGGGAGAGSTPPPGDVEMGWLGRQDAWEGAPVNRQHQDILRASSIVAIIKVRVVRTRVWTAKALGRSKNRGRHARGGIRARRELF